MATQEKSRQGFWQSLFGRDGGQEPSEVAPEPLVEAPSQEPGPEIEIASNDPIVAYFASASGVVEIDKLDLDSPALLAMKAADIKVVVPLVSQGELIGSSTWGRASPSRSTRPTTGSSSTTSPPRPRRLCR